MSHDHDHGTSDMDGDECTTSHAMAFHVGVCQEILFSSWKSTTAWELFGAAVAIFVAGLVYEGLKYFRESLFVKYAPLQPSSQVNITKSECGAGGSCAQPKVVKHSMLSTIHVIQTLLHIVQSTLSYLLMLIFMTYNVWLCIALVAGLGVGYFLFGWQKQTVVDVTEHCQ